MDDYLGKASLIRRLTSEEYLKHPTQEDIHTLHWY